MQRISITNPQNVIDGTAKKYYFRLRNTGGPKGDKGDKGDTGATGPQGPQGNAATVSVGSTTTLPVGYDATVTNTGSIYNAVLDFGIPQGPQGPQGAKGDKGDTGAKGDTGPRGPQGEKGTNATVYVGTTSTLAPGSQATVYNSGSSSNAVLNFGIPQGAKGDTGSQGPQGPAGQNFTPTVVAELPATGDESKLYLTPKAHTSQTATGNPITASISDGAGSMESFQLDGDTAQQTYTGKNLLKMAGNWVIFAGSGVTVTDGDDGSIILNGTVVERQDIRIYSNSNRLRVESGTQLTLSRNTNDYNLIWHRFTSDGSGATSDVVYISVDGAYSHTYTAASTDHGFQFLLRLPTGAVFNNERIYLQLEKGSTATSFERYVGGTPSPNPDYPQPIQKVTGEQTVAINGTNYPISLGSLELCKLGDYQDYIYKDGDGKWYIEKQTGKLKFQSSQGWAKSGTITEVSRFFIRNYFPEGTLAVDKTAAMVISNYFMGISQNQSDAKNIGISQLDSRGFMVNVPNGVFADATAFNAWLDANDVLSYYALGTPTDTVITDTTLIAQLEAIRTAALENGANTITNTATGSNLAGDMEIGYYGYNPTNRYDKFIWLDLNNNYEQIGE